MDGLRIELREEEFRFNKTKNDKHLEKVNYQATYLKEIADWEKKTDDYRRDSNATINQQNSTKTHNETTKNGLSISKQEKDAQLANLI